MRPIRPSGWKAAHRPLSIFSEDGCCPSARHCSDSSGGITRPRRTRHSVFSVDIVSNATSTGPAVRRLVLAQIWIPRHSPELLAADRALVHVCRPVTPGGVAYPTDAVRQLSLIAPSDAALRACAGTALRDAPERIGHSCSTSPLSLGSGIQPARSSGSDSTRPTSATWWVSTPGENLTVPPIENLTDRRGDEPQVVEAS
jgi:hypothetical protein